MAKPRVMDDPPRMTTIRKSLPAAPRRGRLRRPQWLMPVLLFGCGEDAPATTLGETSTASTPASSTTGDTAGTTAPALPTTGDGSGSAGSDATTAAAPTSTGSAADATTSQGTTAAVMTTTTDTTDTTDTTTTSDPGMTTGALASGTETSTSDGTDTGAPLCTTWDRTYGGPMAEHGNAIVRVPGGGFAIAGRTLSKGAGDHDMWLVRIDEVGDVLWDKTYGTEASESANGLAMAPDGGFLLVGTTFAQGLDWWVVRTASDGTELWKKTFGTAEDDHAFAAVAVSEGGFAVAGVRDRVAKGTGRFWLLRLDDAGGVMWEGIYGSLAAEQLAYDLVEIPQQGFAVAGTAQENFWLVRTDGAGKKLWDRSYDHGPTYDRALALEPMPNGGFALAGWSSGDGFADFWTVRTNAGGDMLWAKAYDGFTFDFAEGMAALADGGLVLVGGSNPMGGSTDLQIVRLDVDGKVIWTRTYGGADYDYGMDVVELPNADLAFVGRTQSKGAGDLDIWTLRTDPAGLLMCE